VTLARSASIGGSGLSQASAAAKVRLFHAAIGALTSQTGDARSDTALFVPGRIEVLGKHTDYAGGRSLLCAAEQGFCLVSRPRRDPRIRVFDAVSGDACETALDPGVAPRLGHWSNYPATVARRVALNFPGAATGADIAFASDLPPAAGMSSSSAFMIGVFLALSAANDLNADPRFRGAVADTEALAAYLACIENGSGFGALAGDRGVGTFGGSEDHTAILCCAAGSLSQYRFAPVARESRVALPAGLTFVIASSGVLAEKTGAALAAYNRASRSAARVLETWRRASGRADATLYSAATSSPDARDRIRAALGTAGDSEFSGDVLRDRFDQFCAESLDILPAAAAALGAGDVLQFGALVDRSQRAAETCLGNQIPETMTLARSARACGAVAASAFGAGFGGSVWALVDASRADAFMRAWSAAYREAHPDRASGARFFGSGAGPSARAFDQVDG